MLLNISTLFNFGLNIVWEIDFWGCLAADEGAFVARGEVAAADLRVICLSLIGQVTQAWFGWFEVE